MVVLEAALIVGLVGVLVYAALRHLARPPVVQHPAALPGRWRVAHYDAKGETRVVLQKIATGDGRVLDEHLIATIGADDSSYDAKFLAAMSAARERRALFEAEEEP